MAIKQNEMHILIPGISGQYANWKYNEIFADFPKQIFAAVDNGCVERHPYY